MGQCFQAHNRRGNVAAGTRSVQIEQVPGSKSNFGCVAYNITEVYEAKEIEVRAYMKFSDVQDGVIGLLLRIDGPSGSLGFDNMMNRNIQGTKDWTMYS